MDSILVEVSKLKVKNKISKIILFGSRARGDEKERSDYDLAVFTENDLYYFSFLSDLEALPTLNQFDVVRITNTTSSELLNNIVKEGLIL